MAQRTAAWEIVAERYTTDISDTLQARDWEQLEAMTTPEWVAAIKSKNWTEVGDGEHGAMEGAHAIRAALLGSIDTEPAILDAIKRGKDGQLDTVRSMQNDKRASVLTDYGDSRIGM